MRAASLALIFWLVAASAVSGAFQSLPRCVSAPQAREKRGSGREVQTTLVQAGASGGASGAAASAPLLALLDSVPTQALMPVGLLCYPLPLFPAADRKLLSSASASVSVRGRPAFVAGLSCRRCGCCTALERPPPCYSPGMRLPSLHSKQAVAQAAASGNGSAFASVSFWRPVGGHAAT